MTPQEELERILIEVGRSYGACHMKELNDKVINKAIQDIYSAGYVKKDSIELDGQMFYPDKKLSNELTRAGVPKVKQNLISLITMLPARAIIEKMSINWYKCEYQDVYFNNGQLVQTVGYRIVDLINYEDIKLEVKDEN